MEKGSINRDEIDLIELVRVIWLKRRFILIVTGVFLILGIFIALTTKAEYIASCKLLPETKGSTPNLGSLGGIAGLAGFDVSSLESQNGLSTELYPEIVNSVPFLDKLIREQVYFENEDTVISSFDYFETLERPSFLEIVKGYTIGLPGKVKSLFTSSKEAEIKDYDLVRFTQGEWEIIEAFKERLTVEVNSKISTIKISVEMPDAVAAAKVTDLLVKELTQSVIEYKIEKSQINLEFIEERFFEAKKEFETRQQVVASFTDRNRNITNPIVQTEFERLQNELNIAFEVYKSLATELEQAKIRVKENTPVFTILEPVKIPVYKSKPKKKKIVFTSILIGLFLSCTVITAQNYALKK